MKANVPCGVTRESLSTLLKPRCEMRQAAVEIVCRGFCEYLNGSGGEPECMGFSTVLSGLESRKLDPSHVSFLVARAPSEPRRSGCLINELCSRCGYLEDGCDFMAPDPADDATPCGGYRFLQGLLDCKAVTPDFIRTLIFNSL